MNNTFSCKFQATSQPDDRAKEIEGLGTGKLEFWFEFASTYSYPAAMRIEALAAAHEVEVIWRPFLLAPIFAEVGWRDSPFNIYPAKGRYMWRDLERVCRSAGIAFKRPSVFPRVSLHAARIACHFEGESWVPGFVQAVYRANFEHDRDTRELETIRDCLRSIGLDPGTVEEGAFDEPAKLQLRRQTERAREIGIFGAPSFVTDDELFWGNDRLEDAVRLAAR